MVSDRGNEQTGVGSVGPLTCPVCHQRRRIEDTPLETMISEWNRWQSTDLTRFSTDVCEWDGFHNWACAECIETGRAIVAQPDRLNVSMGPVHFAYFDRQRQCAECQQPFVFSAHEQKYWYETLQFMTRSTAKHCKRCRRNRRRRKTLQKQLQAALDALRPDDGDSLRQVAAIYEDMGCIKKAAEYLARSKNKKD